jgi:CHAD domain-containing protein
VTDPYAQEIARLEKQIEWCRDCFGTWSDLEAEQLRLLKLAQASHQRIERALDIVNHAGESDDWRADILKIDNIGKILRGEA